MNRIRSLALYAVIGPAIALAAAPVLAQQGTQTPEGAQPRTNPDGIQRQSQDSEQPRMTPDRQPPTGSMQGEAQDRNPPGTGSDRRPTTGGIQDESREGTQPRATSDRRPTTGGIQGETRDGQQPRGTTERQATPGGRQDQAPEGMQRGTLSPDGMNTRMPRDGYLSRKPTRGFHAEEMIGSSIRTRGENTDVGPINDLIIDENGQVVAVIVGVGGFLGMGEKDVAIGWDAIQRTPNGDGFEYHIDASRAALGSAPPYTTDR